MEAQKMRETELIFIPFPAIGHLVPAVESAKLLIKRDHRLSITVLIMNMPMDKGVANYTQSLQRDATDGMKVVELPLDDSIFKLVWESNASFLSAFINSQTAHVRDIVADILTRSDSTRLAGIVIDFLNTALIDVANEFGVPTYVFYVSSAAFLGLTFYLQSLTDDHGQDITEYQDTEASLSVPCFLNPVPAKFLPSVGLDKEGFASTIVSIARRLRQTKGIILNTVLELETHAVMTLADGKTPPVYSVGPVLNIPGGQGTTDNQNSDNPVITWLDDQPPSSVVFLCFGSLGSFDVDQVKEIAQALEHSGHRFLWSLRRPPAQEERELAGEYDNPQEVLPEGFLERTAGIGKVVGWAPQVAVLSHSAVGGFVSHCGWNSILESLWYGVPMATWPMFGDQQILAFEMVKELELAVDIKMDFKKDFYTTNSAGTAVTVKEIESGIRCLMDGGSEIRKKVKEMKEKTRMALVEGGSSYTSVGRLIEDIMNNSPE
ncbi:hypothetical protein RJ639_011401 [Escallonia herrerae]|uniref:Glycosyltransferase n=1 Tax=Escallonia herrerae TaxID=1293975 RepID=A0AA88VMQ4_9ASTE|nr:hypothetical protein RJ639_011401 [Escallonia herrerae]